MRIAARMFEQNGTLFIGAGIAVLVLILLVIVSRRMRQSPDMAGSVAAPNGPTLPDGDIDLKMADDATAQGETIIFETEISPGPLDDTAAHQFDLDDDALDDIDELTIPKLGEAPPPRKSRLFSASWLHRESPAEPKIIAEGFETPDSKTMKEASECARLAEIERNMLALRELYEAGLIAPEVYVLKAREFAAQAA